MKVEDKLVNQLEQLDGVVSAHLEPESHGVFRVDVTVRAGRLDEVWDELVEQVDSFEHAMNGSGALDLEITTE